MSVDYRGSITLGQAIPMATAASVALAATSNSMLPDVQARVGGLLQLSIQPPPSLPALISSAQALLAALQGLIANPIPDVAATAAALADLQATLGQLQAGLALAINLGNLLGVPGIHYYVYEGPTNVFAAEMGALLSSGLPGGGAPADTMAGAVLLARDGGAINALRLVLQA